MFFLRSYQVVEHHKTRLTVDNQILLKKLDRKERKERTLLEQLQTKERKIQVGGVALRGKKDIGDHLFSRSCFVQDLSSSSSLGSGFSSMFTGSGSDSSGAKSVRGGGIRGGGKSSVRGGGSTTQAKATDKS